MLERPPLTPNQMPRRALILALLALLPGSGCSGDPPAGAAASAPTPPPDPTASGMVWRVSGGNAPFFLAGSFHLLRSTDYPLPAPYDLAWRECRHLVMEIAPGDASSPETLAGLPALITLPGGTLESRIAPETWQQLTTWAQLTRTPLEELQTMPPWMAGLTIAVTTSSQLGFRSSQGMERHFITLLQGSGKTSEGLETVLGQMSLFGKFPPPPRKPCSANPSSKPPPSPAKSPSSPKPGATATPTPSIPS